MTLATYVRIVAQGKGRARSLTLDEVDAAMSIILSGKAASEAVGALFRCCDCAAKLTPRLPDLHGHYAGLRRTVVRADCAVGCE